MTHNRIERSSSKENSGGDKRRLEKQDHFYKGLFLSFGEMFRNEDTLGGASSANAYTSIEKAKVPLCWQTLVCQKMQMAI
jgi:hypothetical protein